MIEQHGAQLKIVDSLDCGYVVRGTTDVALGDAALEAMATMATNAIGVTAMDQRRGRHTG